MTLASGAFGTEAQYLREELDRFERATGTHVDIISVPPSSNGQFGQFKAWLNAHKPEVDVYRTDVIWAPQLVQHLVDLRPSVGNAEKDFLPDLIRSQTANGRLVALPLFTEPSVLYYRKDLLAKYHAEVPKTWTEMADTAKAVMERERQAGNRQMWGFVFDAAPYEGLTTTALEWIASNDGGDIVEHDGTISIDNARAVEILTLARSWIGTIAPTSVLSFEEEDARRLWQKGDAVFMRNWPYAYELGNYADSPVKGQFDIAPLPMGPSGTRSIATIGGWNLAAPGFLLNLTTADFSLQQSRCLEFFTVEVDDRS
jgi:trehalose/maltose transport system substrate-binding protein